MVDEPATGIGRRAVWWGGLGLALLCLVGSGGAIGESRPGLPPDYPESRREVDTREYPWSAIGRVTTTGRGVTFCTGTLVGERVVVTAAHCLWNRTTKRWYPPEYVHFVAGYQREVRLAHSVARRIVVSDEFEFRRNPTQSELRVDWAILELAEPIGRSVGHVGWARLDETTWQWLGERSTDFSIAGYRSDRREVQTVDDRCRLAGFVDAGRLATHLCPIVQGDSGGPLLLVRGGDVFLAGLHVGAVTDRGGGGETTGLILPSSRFADRLEAFGLGGVEIVGQPELFGRRGARAQSRP